MQTIAVIGSGNVGGALARRLIEKGHSVVIGARFPLSEKSQKLTEKIDPSLFMPIEQAAAQSSILIITAPATQAVAVTKQLGNTEGKIIIDTMNVVMGRGPEGFTNTSDAILAHTASRDVVKCFNTTGFENMLNPVYKGKGIDMFMCGDSSKGKETASMLAKSIGFGSVHDMGGNAQFYLLEQLAGVWIQLAIFRGAGRDTALQFIKR